MDLDLISLISKNYLPSLLGGILFLASCSSHKKTDADDIKLAEELASLSKKVQTINYGPTIKSGVPFVDKTKEYGLENLYGVSFYAVDLNMDGYTDLVILPSYYSRPEFYIFNSELKKFEKWSHDPLPVNFKASYLLFYDLNKDRVLDLVAGVLNQKSEVSKVPVKFYQGKITNGNLSFEENVDAIKLPPEPTSSISVIDYDLDGWPDLFIGNWFETKNAQHYPVADRLLKNQKGKFIDVSHLLTDERTKLANQIFPPLAKPTYGSSTCDIDQNGYPDILTVSSSGYQNKLWMNQAERQSGGRFFEDVGPVSNYGSDPDGSLIPTGGGRNFFSACADYNSDGIMDVFIGMLSHAYDNESVDKSSILTGSKETYPPYFLRTEYLSDVLSESWNQGDRRGVWLDYNLDGKIDILVDNSGFPPHSRLVMFEQDETKAFSNVASQLGIDVVNPTGTIVIDLNKDGLPDIITAQNNVRKADISPRIYVFENQMKFNGKKAIKVNLRGIKSNTHGIGAMVSLFTEKDGSKEVLRRWVEYTQGGLSSQNEMGVHFGVGHDVKALGIKVKWPYAQRSGFNQGQPIEKLYQLKNFIFEDYLEVTVCEDGKILKGNISCQL